jgi:ABC-type branched-subunit amino acid transport system substrate-binding protein
MMARGTEARRSVNCLAALLGWAVLAIVAIASGPFGGSASAAEPIQIGAAITMSPPGPVVYGTQITEGFTIALKMINDKGGVLGRPLNVVYEDHQGIPEKGRAAVEKLITRDKVVAITGVELSNVVLQAMEVAKQYNVPFINTNGWDDTIRTKGYKQVFSPNNYSSRTSIAIAEALAALGVKKVAAIHENTNNGKIVASKIKSTLEDTGWKGEYQITYVDQESRDFLPAILPLKRAQADVIVVQAQPPGGYIIFKQLYEQGVAPTSRTILMDAGAIADAPDFWKSVGEAGKYLVGYGLYHPKMKLPELGQQFERLFRERYSRGVSRLALQSADSLFLLADAIQRAGGTDSEAIQRALRETKLLGTRGMVTFSQSPGFTFQQWVDTPNVFYQFTEVNQDPGETTIVGGTGVKMGAESLVRPK